MNGWNIARGDNWVPDLPTSQPDTDFDKYGDRFELWLDENYDVLTDSVFGVPNDSAYTDEMLFEKFMDEVIRRED